MHKTCFVRFGTDGRQVAVLIGTPGKMSCRKWRKKSRRWTGPVPISADEILGPVSGEEIRRYRVDFDKL